MNESLLSELAQRMAERHGVSPDTAVVHRDDEGVVQSQTTYLNHLIDVYIRPIIQDYLNITSSESNNNGN